MMLTNEALLHAYCAGDDEALSTIFYEKGYWEKCRFKAYSFLKSKNVSVEKLDEAAEDITQKVILDLLRKQPEVRKKNFEVIGKTETDFRNYVLTMAQFKSIDFLRKEIRETNTRERYHAKMQAESESEEILEDLRKACEELVKRIYANKKGHPNYPSEDLEYLAAFLAAGPRKLRPAAEILGLNPPEEHLNRLRTAKQRIKRHLEPYCTDLNYSLIL